MEKKYIVTYNSIDEKTREFIWNASKVDVPTEDAVGFGKLIQYCDSGVWPETGIDDGHCIINWGFTPSTSMANIKPMSYRMRKVKGLVHREILKPIALEIARECEVNRELFLLILKSAYRFAGGIDSERVNLELAYGNEKAALEKAFSYRNTISLMEMKMEIAPGSAIEIMAMLVEEYECNNILSIKPY